MPSESDTASGSTRRSWTEAERVTALDSYDILDTPPEPDFDEIAQFAAEALDAPIAVINLVADDRQWFKAEVGIGTGELPLDVSICAHAILQDDFMVVPDTRKDDRFSSNPLVTVDGGLRFYAGALLRSDEGLPIGTVCVLDRAPRPDGISASQRRLLEVLARQVMTQLELRRALAAQKQRTDELRSVEERYRLAARATNDAIWDWDFATDHVLWNDAITTAYGHRPDAIEATGRWWIEHIHPEDRTRIEESIHTAIDEGGIHWTDEYRFGRADGSYAPVLDRGFIIHDEDGKPCRMIGAMLDLSERRRGEADLRTSNARFRAAVDAIDGYLWTNSAEGEMRGPQPGWAALTGQSREDYEGYGWSKAVHPDDAERSIEVWQAAVASRTMYVHEHRVRNASGEWRHYATRAVPMFDDQGALSEWVGIHTDITERRAQRAELQANQARLQFLDDLGRAMAAATDANEIMAITTRMVAQYLGISNCAYADMDADEDGFTIRGDWAAPESPSIVGHYSLRDFGTLAVKLLHAGKPLVINDNAVEIAPHEAAAFQAIGIAATICMPLVRSGKLIALMAIHDKLPRQWSDSELKLITAVTERSWAHIERVRANRALAELNAGLEQRIQERTGELMAAEEALRQAQKMEAVGQLTGGIAHDFNNLLTIVMGSVDIAKRALASGDTPRVARAMDNAQKGVERAAALTQRLLAFSRRQPLDPKPLNADRLVAGMSDMLNRTLGEMVSIEVVTSPGLWRIEADPNQLESAILNLAVNARDAMPGGGKLTIETANVRLDEAYTAAHAEVAPGQYVVICLTDTGAGMSRGTLSRVFEPFFTTKEVGKGTGLGLSQVYGFVKQSGGHVTVYSEAGEGTTVKLYLPRLMGEGADDGDDAPVALGEAARHGETILVVEDDHDVRAYTVEILRELGYRVLEAHDGMSALRLIERRDTPVDLMFTDVVMPGMSGRELVDRARALKPHLKILYTSGYTRNAIVHGGRLEPGVQLIAKPFTYEAVAQKIRDVLESGTSGRVLVVAADAADRRTLRDALASEHYAVDEAATAVEALSRIRAAHGCYVAVLLHLASGSKIGLEHAAELRAAAADLPLMLLVAEANRTTLDDMFKCDPCAAIAQGLPEAGALAASLTRLGAECAATLDKKD